MLLGEPAFFLASDWTLIRDEDTDDRVQFVIAAPVSGRITITIPNLDGGTFVVADNSGDVDLGAGDFTTTGKGTFGDVITPTVTKAGGVDIGDGSFWLEICSNGSQPNIHAADYDLLITADGGDISFGDENLATTGTLSVGSTINCTTGDLTITASGGDISFGDENLATTSDLACVGVNCSTVTASGTVNCAGGTSSANFVFGLADKIQFKEYDTTVGFELFCYGTVDDNGAIIDTEASDIPLYIRTASTCRILVDHVNGVYIGDGTNAFPAVFTNYISVATNGDLNFNGTAGFYPRFVEQAAEPANGTGATQIDDLEMLIWRDTDDDKIYLMFNDNDNATKKIVKVELT